MPQDQVDPEAYKEAKDIKSKLAGATVHEYKNNKQLSLYAFVAPMEDFFNDLENCNIADLLLQSIAKIPPPFRGVACRNVILTGGVLIVPGFVDRLREEVISKVEAPDSVYAHLKNDIKHLAFFNYKFPSNVVSWAGGSLKFILRQDIHKAL